MPPKKKAAAAVAVPKNEEEIDSKVTTKKAAKKTAKEANEDVESKVTAKKATKRSAVQTTNSDVAKKPTKKNTKSTKEAKDVEDVDDADAEEPVKKTTKGRGRKAKEDKEDVANGDEDKPKPAKRGRAKAVKEKEEATDSKETKEKGAATYAKKPKKETSWESIDFKCVRKNCEGKEHNFKISSWNVGGLKSWIKKECLQFVEHEEPDILCMQETKCNESKLPEEMKDLEGYHQYWCASQKEGYAGVGLLSKVQPIDVVYGINNKELDQDGRCITAEYEKFYVVCVYVPNSGRGLVTLPKRLKWNDLFKDFINGLNEKKPVIICGDMNVSHTEIDLARPKSNTKNAGFTPEERQGMTEFLGEGYVDSFRAIYPDKTDIYTFWTYMANARANNVGWRLDYFIVSENFMPKICDNVMRTEVTGSDHCPITLFLNV